MEPLKEHSIDLLDSQSTLGQSIITQYGQQSDDLVANLAAAPSLSDQTEVSPQAPSSDDLNESWCELSMSSVRSKASGTSTPSMEKLLSEAQKETGLISRASMSSRNSIKVIQSPPPSSEGLSTGESASSRDGDESQDDIQPDWSSRLEIKPPRGYLSAAPRLHSSLPSRYSLRRSRMLSDGISADGLVTLLTHTASFVIGATVMVFWFRRQH